MRAVLHFDPMSAPAGIVGAIKSLRDNALKAHAAGSAE
jgi:hypothetical protein